MVVVHDRKVKSKAARILARMIHEKEKDFKSFFSRISFPFTSWVSSENKDRIHQYPTPVKKAYIPPLVAFPMFKSNSLLEGTGIYTEALSASLNHISATCQKEKEIITLNFSK